MDEPIFLYRNRPDAQFYDASTGEMRGGPDKVIVDVDGILCAMDREARITMPVSRWKLAELGLACFMTALRGKGGKNGKSEVPRPLEREPFVPPPELLAEQPEEATERKSSQDQWERLLRDMRDLSQ